MDWFLVKKAWEVVRKPDVCGRPHHVQLEVTTHCNLACYMCVRNEVIKNPRHLSLADFQRLFDQIQPRRLTLSGAGEPLLNPDLVAMVAHASRHGAATMVPTNGTLLGQAELGAGAGPSRPEHAEDLDRCRDGADLPGHPPPGLLRPDSRRRPATGGSEAAAQPPHAGAALRRSDPERELGRDPGHRGAGPATGHRDHLLSPASGHGHRETSARRSAGMWISKASTGPCRRVSRRAALSVRTNLKEVARDFATYRSIYVRRDAAGSSGVPVALGAVLHLGRGRAVAVLCDVHERELLGRQCVGGGVRGGVERPADAGDSSPVQAATRTRWRSAVTALPAACRSCSR